MFYILYGLDDYSLGQYINEIREGLGDLEMLQVNTNRLDGGKLTESELKNYCYAMPFLSPYRLVIVDGLLGQFESKRGKQQSAGTDTAKSGKRQKEWQNLGEIIRGIPQSTVLILVDVDITVKNSMLKKLETWVKDPTALLKNPDPLTKEVKVISSPKLGPLEVWLQRDVPKESTEWKKPELQAVIKAFPLLKLGDLRNWIKRRVSEESANISDGAVTVLIEFIGSNLWSMSNVIKQLVLYVRGRAINEKDVADLADYSRESNIFLLVDAIVEGNNKVAQRMFYRMYQSGSSPSYIMFMITRQFRLIAQALGLDPGLSARQIQTKLGVSGYPLEKTLKQAKSYNLSQVSRAYTELIQTDMAIKSGKYLDNQLALEFMILSIGRAG